MVCMLVSVARVGAGVCGCWCGVGYRRGLGSWFAWAAYGFTVFGKALAGGGVVTWGVGVLGCGGWCWYGGVLVMGVLGVLVLGAWGRGAE